MAIYTDRYNERSDGSSWVNYYTTVPTLSPIDTSPVDDALEKLKPPQQRTGDPIDIQSGTDSTTELNQQFERLNFAPSMDASLPPELKMSEVNFEDIKYKTFNDYIKAEKGSVKLDRSGVFSDIEFPKDEKSTVRNVAKGFGTAEILFTGFPIGGALISQFDTETFKSPTGQDRFVQKGGIGNWKGTYDLVNEYKDLNILKDLQSDTSAKLKGFAMQVGDRTVYRMNGETRYKGLPDNLPQNVARTLEALSKGFNPRGYDPLTENGDEQILTVTDKDGNITSGYNLNGSFTMITGQTAAMGTMNDFNNYAVSQWGNKYGLGFEQAKSFARGWMESARAKFGGILGRGTAAEKLAHLKEWQERAKKAGSFKKTKKEKIKTALDEYNFTKTDISKMEKKEEQFKASQKGKVSSSDAASRGVTATTPKSTFSMVNRPSYEDPYASQLQYETNYRNIGQTDDNEDKGGVGTGGGGDPFGGLEFSEGGRVNMAMGSGEEEIMLDDNRVEPIIKDDRDMVITGNELLENEKTQKSGFINKPASQTSDQEGIADDTAIQLRNDQNPEGATIVMNKPSIDLMGEKNFVRMVKDGLRYLRSKGKPLSENDDDYIKKNFTDVAISSGEAVIQPELANVLGRKRLLALNERGKRRVSKAKKQSASEGGFIKKKFGDEINESGFMVEPVSPKVLKSFKELDKRSSFQRKNVENLIDNFSDQEALAMLIFAESYLSSDSMPELEAIGETVLNRVNDKTYSFKNINSIKDVLKQRSKRGKGSKMFMYDGLEPRNLKPRLKEMMNSNYWTKAMAAAENVLTMGGGEPDYQRHLRDDVFTYGRVGKAADRLANNLRNEEYITLGNHTFFSRVPEKGGRLSLEEMGMPDSFYRGENPRSFYFQGN